MLEDTVIRHARSLDAGLDDAVMRQIRSTASHALDPARAGEEGHGLWGDRVRTVRRRPVAGITDNRVTMKPGGLQWSWLSRSEQLTSVVLEIASRWRPPRRCGASTRAS
jgi:hypothetical protein